jgi:hypothetical protein
MRITWAIDKDWATAAARSASECRGIFAMGRNYPKALTYRGEKKASVDIEIPHQFGNMAGRFHVIESVFNLAGCGDEES